MLEVWVFEVVLQPKTSQGLQKSSWINTKSLSEHSVFHFSKIILASRELKASDNQSQLIRKVFRKRVRLIF